MAIGPTVAISVTNGVLGDMRTVATQLREIAGRMDATAEDQMTDARELRHMADVIEAQAKEKADV